MSSDTDLHTGWTKLAGTSARARIIEAILSHPGQYEITCPEIADDADVHIKTVYDHIDDLTDLGLIEHVRTVGRTRLYEIQMDSEVTRALFELDGAATRAHVTVDGNDTADGGDD